MMKIKKLVEKYREKNKHLGYVWKLFFRTFSVFQNKKYRKHV